MHRVIHCDDDFLSSRLAELSTLEKIEVQIFDKFRIFSYGISESVTDIRD